ncbi:hypothetical protein [Desulfosporosinus hippei]|uniref:Uncharacterized protein n=1 Tax=Desulfosporosinus hippei DSM 8344 TaxID=1121419 RepID=A0A1G8LNY3_9FIRM|nr:hypothetical protein [Desulfosporosinus hippei]SDI57386.1 hypothetical protein SAMN05443529_1525 [Desulfosporosinus hippei DSM 8344]
MQKICRVVLVLKVPSAAGSSLDFRTKLEDINYAITQFNKRFEGFKQVKLLAVKNQELEFLLSIEVEDKSVIPNARDLSAFSKRLYHDRSWSIYSRENAKLFTATVFEDVTEEYAEHFENLPDIPKNLTKTVANDVSRDINTQMNDQQAIEAFEALLKIQNIGDENKRSTRKKSIIEIKSILLSTLS